MGTETEKRWTDIAKKMLVGRKITAVRYLTTAEAKRNGWFKRPLVLQLDDGNLIYPTMDDEGNDGGAIFTNDDIDPTLPTI